MKTKEIAEALGVSERMIRKYMDDLYEANVNVVSIPGPTGGLELQGYDYLSQLQIQHREVGALKVATQVLGQNESFGLYSELESLQDKISIVAEKNSVYESGSNREIDKGIGLLESHLNPEIMLQAASITKNKVKIIYKSVSSGLSERIVRPYTLINKAGFAYLIAYCEKREEIRTFKLVRIQSLEVLEDQFEEDNTFDAKGFIKDQIGLFNDETIRLKLHIHKPFAYSVSERVYASDQKIVCQEDESILFEATMKGKVDIIRWILSMRTCVTVLEPLELKEEIKEELTRMLKSI